MNLRRQFLTENACFIAGKAMKPAGIMLHSTGANNPRISRYVSPDDGLLGTPSPSNWNQRRPDGRQVCVHTFIGKIENGSVAAYQALPWDVLGWHSGGAANGTHIGIEICEDGLDDPEYFSAVYQEAAELCAYLCGQYGIKPEIPELICHAEGYRLGIASNHADVEHWFPRHGKSMNDFRETVAALIETYAKALTTVEAAFNSGLLSDMEYWFSVLKGETVPRPDFLKILLDNAIRMTAVSG